jgi:sporulation protein YlmC with PRC-barrel domain
MASLDDITNTSGRLIAARQVQGTTVYNAALEKLGTVEDVMIDKAAGRIAYAVLSFGGFLGVGDRYYPLPWEKLAYNSEVGGYVVDIDRDVLEGAPSYTGRLVGRRGLGS